MLPTLPVAVTDANEPEEHEDRNNPDNDVADTLQLTFYRNVLEDERDDEQNNKWRDSPLPAHRSFSVGERAVRRLRKYIFLLHSLPFHETRHSTFSGSREPQAD